MTMTGIEEAFGFILSSHRTEASWERYQNNIAEARAEVGERGPGDRLLRRLAQSPALDSILDGKYRARHSQSSHRSDEIDTTDFYGAQFTYGYGSAITVCDSSSKKLPV